MEIGIISDEISSDVEEAFKFGRELGINSFELRGVGNKRIPEIKNSEIEELQNLVQNYKINITALSPGILKTSLAGNELAYHKNELLEKTFSLAEKLDVTNIIIFGLIKKQDINEKIKNKVIKNISEVVEKADTAGFKILLENEAGCYAGTAAQTLEIIEAIQHPALKVNWDPGNAYRAGGNPFPEGFELIKNYVDNVHVKDVEMINGNCEWTTIDRGKIDWQGQVKALKQDNYQGLLVIENHCQPLKESTKKNYDKLTSFL